MNPILLLAAVGAAGYWGLKRVAAKKTQALKEAAVGKDEGTVVDLGTQGLPSNEVPMENRASTPTEGKVFVIPRLLEILSPQDGEEVDRPGFLGDSYPVTIRWTNSLALAWKGRLTAEVAEDDEPPRQIDLGEWTIAGGATRSAVVSVGFGGGRVNFGRTFVRLRIRFGDHPATAAFYVD